MKTTTRKDMTRRPMKMMVSAAACAGALVLAGAPMALGDEDPSTTEVTVAADPDETLSFRAPVSIPFEAMPDGTLTGPSPESTQIVNESIFGIHVTKAKVAADSNWEIVQDATASDADNAIDFQFGPEKEIDAWSAIGTVDISADTSFNMGHAGTDTAAVSVDSQGNVANVKLDLTEPVPVATISWTVAAGAAAES